MNSLSKIISGVLIAGFLALTLKPLLLHGNTSAASQYTASSSCPNRLLSTTMCLATGFYAIIENQAFDSLAIFALVISLLSFSLMTFYSSWYSQRLLRPPICS